MTESFSPFHIEVTFFSTFFFQKNNRLSPGSLMGQNTTHAVAVLALFYKNTI